jgi:spore germination protein YaaH
MVAALFSLLVGTAASSASIGDRALAQETQPVRRGRMLGYYVPYDSTSWDTLAAQAAYIDEVAVQWVTIDACGQIGSHDDRTLIQFAHERGVRVLPSLLTTSGSLNHRLLTDDATSARAISQILDYVSSEGYDGFDLDLENVRPEDRSAYSAFAARLGTALRQQGKVLTIALPGKFSDAASPWWGGYDYAALGEAADLVTVMAYEYRGAWSGPGSVAPFPWVEKVLDFATDQIAPEKVLLGLAIYGFDWDTTFGGARPLSYVQAAALAEYHQTAIGLDPETRSATFRYQTRGTEGPQRIHPPPVQHEIVERVPPPCSEPVPVVPTPTPRPTPPPDAVQAHEVWLEDRASVAARLALADRYGAGGVAAWRLGLEDPRVWPTLDQWRAPAR